MRFSFSRETEAVEGAGMKKGEMTRQRILELAAPLFNQRGYAGCSIGDIMEATGLEKGGIYRHFGSKEALAAEVFQYALGETKKLRVDDLEAIPGALGKLRAVMDRFLSEPSPIQGGCALLNTAVDADDGNEVLRALVNGAFRDWRARLAALVEEGVRSGEFRASCQPDEVADTIVAALEGGLLLSRLDGQKRALQNVRRSLDLLLTAQLGEPIS
jgi:TetR/AcrR family transcriptional regulator, transcriptional repressor for nem operon